MNPEKIKKHLYKGSEVMGDFIGEIFKWFNYGICLMIFYIGYGFYFIVIKIMDYIDKKTDGRK